MKTTMIAAKSGFAAAARQSKSVVARAADLGLDLAAHDVTGESTCRACIEAGEDVYEIHCDSDCRYFIVKRNGFYEWLQEAAGYRDALATVMAYVDEAE